MERKKITMELLLKILNTFFPNGYGRSFDRKTPYDQQWYLGWLNIRGYCAFDYPTEINLDAGATAIIFKWYGYDSDGMELSNAEIHAYINGVMAMLVPDLPQWSSNDSESTMMMFQYPKNDEQ